MKKTFLTLIVVLISTITFSQNVGIGTNTPDSSALLELNSNSKGFLPPRMTMMERDAIQNPAEGLMIFNTTKKCTEVFAAGAWQSMYCYLPPSFNDNSGYVYSTVQICDQTWMQNNLAASKYRNGDIIPQVTDPNVWLNATAGAWCWYNNDSASNWQYGKLYNYYAVKSSKGLAPEGWHIASDQEWATLIDCLGGNNVAGGKMKETGTTHWNSPNTGATNISGFSAFAGGYRYSGGDFLQKGENIYWWGDTGIAYKYGLYYLDANISRNTYDYNWGFSVRCVKDLPVSQTINNGLVAYYPFNGNANDESGNGNNGTVNGATLTTDRFGNNGKAYSFDGSSYIKIIDDSTIDLTNNLSITAWYNVNFLNSSTNSTIISKASNSQANMPGYWLGINSYSSPSKIDFQAFPYLNGSNYFSSINSFPIDQWHQITITYDYTNKKLTYYSDGIMTNTFNNVMFQIQNTSLNLYIGNHFQNNNPLINVAVSSFNGKLDDIRIYNRALSQSEVTYLATH